MSVHESALHLGWAFLLSEVHFDLYFQTHCQVQHESPPSCLASSKYLFPATTIPHWGSRCGSGEQNTSTPKPMLKCIDVRHSGKDCSHRLLTYIFCVSNCKPRQNLDYNKRNLLPFSCRDRGLSWHIWVIRSLSWAYQWVLIANSLANARPWPGRQHFTLSLGLTEWKGGWYSCFLRPLVQSNKVFLRQYENSKLSLCQFLRLWAILYHFY